MTSNRDWLFSLPLDEQLAWMSAEHVEGVEIQGEMCVKSSLPPNSVIYDVDSREKLEADAIQLAQNIWHQGQNYANGVREIRHIAWQERDIIELLDRQAAITERECIDTRVNFAERIRLFQRGYDVGVHDLKKAADMANRVITHVHSKYEPVLTEDCTESVDGFTDSREKLEDDIHKFLSDGGRAEIKRGDWNAILAWLDRQAAITEQELHFDELLKEYGRAKNDLETLRRQYKVAREELQDMMSENGRTPRAVKKRDRIIESQKAEIDSLQYKINQLETENAELRAKLAEWEKITEGIDLPDYPMAQYQPNSRADLEAEVHYWLTSHVAVSVNVGEIEAEVRKWLDAQASMTASAWSGYMADAAKQIDLLHARLDHLPDERECEICDRATMVCEINALEAECLYWKGQMLKSLECATENYAEGVMAYPRPDGYTEPSLLVNDEMNCLRDFHADDKRLIAKLEAEVGELRDDAHKYRTLAGDLLDAAQNMQRIADRGLA